MRVDAAEHRSQAIRAGGGGQAASRRRGSRTDGRDRAHARNPVLRCVLRSKGWSGGVCVSVEECVRNRVCASVGACVLVYTVHVPKAR